MKKIIIRTVLCTFLLLPVSGFAESYPWHFSIEPLAGLKTGETGEYVFLKNSRYSSNKLSELDWEMTPVFYGGTRINAGWNHISVSGYVTGAVPASCGLMKDSDWKNILYSNTEDYQYKTNYSESDNTLNDLITTGIRAGFTFTPSDALSLTPYASFDFEYMRFTASGGTCWYGKTIGSYYASYDDEDNRTVSTMSGNVVQYTRYTYFIWVGGTASYHFTPALSVTAGFRAAPYVYCESQDKHYLTGGIYVDITDGFFCAYSGTIGLEYQIDERSSLVLSAEGFYLKTITGPSYQTNNGTVLLSSQTGGASEQYVSVSLAWKIRII